VVEYDLLSDVRETSGNSAWNVVLGFFHAENAKKDAEFAETPNNKYFKVTRSWRLIYRSRFGLIKIWKQQH